MTHADAIELIAKAIAKSGGFDLDEERRMSTRGSASSDMLVVEFENAARLVLSALIENYAFTATLTPAVDRSEETP